MFVTQSRAIIHKQWQESRGEKLTNPNDELGEHLEACQ